MREIVVGGSDLVWDLRDDRGVAVPSGIYFARAAAGPPVRVTVLR
ncbi:MAG: hypothetical protein R3E12_15540 [Candidatus Eisenbacteria bacterium]